MRRILLIVVTAVTLTLGGASAASAHHQQDYDCDGYDDITGLAIEPHGRANGVCGGVY